MKKALRFTLTIVTISCIALFVGCQPAAPPAASEAAPKTEAAADPHAALHQTKYNQTLVEFPGHRYAMEIIDENETTGLVTAFLTDAHFNPVEVDTKEVRLNFTVSGAPKTFTLTRTEQATGKPATFTLTDKELATLNCEGWQGEATASVDIGGTPYNAKLTKLAGHDHEEHNHEGHDHAH